MVFPKIQMKRRLPGLYLFTIYSLGFFEFELPNCEIVGFRVNIQ